MSTDSLAADESIAVTTTGGRAVAQLWWTRSPTLPGETPGVIGAFSATSADAAGAVLAQAAARLERAGCTIALGPMDGTTWRSYRFVTEAGTEPPFLFEPVNPPEWPGWWRAAGFAPLADYISTVAPDLAARDSRVAAVARRMAGAGVSIRPIQLGNFEAELGRIHDVSIISFRDNFLYTPISREAFLAQYRPMETQACAELVLIAEQAGRPVGYLFGVPDLMEARRGAPVRTVIVKTLAVLPGRAFAGLGALLLDTLHAAAHRLGFTRAIHALMHETNTSRALSAHTARTIRRYALFARRLRAP
ncbi:GNAT family N-acetyltransferase [Horticoccus sp. 23ND18S-11]|uniref:GNAT family N-acetyltransferase n=1 Tax=Horticoccus sp. 23ND18S-11 TaxID=3391832 RepID=UPI0039C9AA0E